MLAHPSYLFRCSTAAGAPTKRQRNSLGSRATPFPDNACPRAIGLKGQDLHGDVTPVQGEYRVPKTALRLDSRVASQRVIDAASPAEFLKGSQDGELIPGGLPKSFDDQLANPEFFQIGIPGRVVS